MTFSASALAGELLHYFLSRIPGGDEISLCMWFFLERAGVAPEFVRFHPLSNAAVKLIRKVWQFLLLLTLESSENFRFEELSIVSAALTSGVPSSAETKMQNFNFKFTKFKSIFTGFAQVFERHFCLNLAPKMII